MWPNLKSVVAQAWRSIGSTRRNLSSSRGSKGSGFDAFVERNFNREQLSRRGIGLFSGFFVAAVTVQHPAGRLEKRLEESNREYAESLRE